MPVSTTERTRGLPIGRRGDLDDAAVFLQGGRPHPGERTEYICLPANFVTAS
jgi:hypothetical protein